MVKSTKPDTITFLVPPPPMVDYRFGEIKPVTVRGINKFLVGDGKLERNIRDRFTKSKVMKDNSVMDIRDPRLQALLKDRQGLNELMKTADQTGFLGIPVQVTELELPFGKDWNANLQKEHGAKILTFYKESERHPEAGNRVDENRVILLQAQDADGKEIHQVAISADSNKGEDLQMVYADYDPETGKVKPETIGEAYGSYDFGKKKNH